MSLVAALAALSLSACSSNDAQDDAGKTIVGFYPLEYLATSIGGSDVDVESLAQPGVEPHDMELSPKQVASVGEARLVIYQKGLQAAVDDAVEVSEPPHVLDVAAVHPPTATAGEEALPDEHEHDHDHGHDHGGLDPHIWLDPKVMVELAVAVRDSLSEVDPGHQQDFDARYQTLAAQLEQLDADYQQGLASCQRHSIVTTHEAFGHLAEAYGLTQVGIAGLSENEPSPQRLQEVKAFVADHDVTTIFYEEAVSDKYAATVAKETGASTAVLNPLEMKPESGDYLSVMRTNLTELRAALGCS